MASFFPMLHLADCLQGLDAIEKKTGHSTSRATNEKITDEGRSLYEKETGSVYVRFAGFAYNY